MELHVTDDVWDRPIEVTIDCGDHFRVVRNSREAVECLMRCWPQRGGKDFSQARRACIGALEGTTSTTTAVAAFTAAAKSAGILRN